MIFFDDQAEVRDSHASEAFILKSKVEKPFPLRAVCEAILQNLPEECCLARAAHADDRNRFVRDDGDMDVASRELRYGLEQRIDDFSADEVAHIVLLRRTVSQKIVRLGRIESVAPRVTLKVRAREEGGGERYSIASTRRVRDQASQAAFADPDSASDVERLRD